MIPLKSETLLNNDFEELKIILLSKLFDNQKENRKTHLKVYYEWKYFTISNLQSVAKLFEQLR